MLFSLRADLTACFLFFPDSNFVDASLHREDDAELSLAASHTRKGFIDLV